MRIIILLPSTKGLPILFKAIKLATPLSDIVKSFLVKKYKKKGEAFLGVVHRLDRPVSGVVLFAKTSKALSRLNLLFREKKSKKRIGQW